MIKKSKKEVNKGKLSSRKEVFKKYKFRKSEKNYSNLFKKEKAQLLNVFPKKVIIEHIGSTSVPGLGGKGIIDIIIKTPKNKIKEFTKKLNKLGYTSVLGHTPTKNSIFFQKIKKYRGRERRVHVHLVLNKPFWNTFTAVREYLKTHEKERKEYAQIKKEAINKNLEGKKYRAYKHQFLENLTKKALKNRK